MSDYGSIGTSEFAGALSDLSWCCRVLLNEIGEVFFCNKFDEIKKIGKTGIRFPARLLLAKVLQRLRVLIKSEKSKRGFELGIRFPGNTAAVP